MCTQKGTAGQRDPLLKRATVPRPTIQNRVDKTKSNQPQHDNNPHTWYRVARNSATPSGAPLPHTSRTATRESREHVRVQASR